MGAKIKRWPFNIISACITFNVIVFCQTKNLEVNNCERLEHHILFHIKLNCEAKPPTEKEPKRLIFNEMPSWASASPNSPFKGK